MIEVFFILAYAIIVAAFVRSKTHLRLHTRLEVLLLASAALAVGLYALTQRMTQGLGATTHLSDSFPWGIWISVDLCGIALASGGFILAGIVHLFRVHRLEPILRPTVLTAFIAYQLVAAILVLDLGRPLRFWHPLVMWQHHSVMFEITLCLALYTVVLALEFSPVLFEYLGFHRAVEALQKMTLPVVMAGVILSTLHQSSFGSLFLIVPQKLSPYWYTPILPILFLLSAVCAGLGVALLECVLFERAAGGERLDAGIVPMLARWTSRALMLYVIVRLTDLLVRGSWRAVFQHPWLDASLAVEIIAGSLLPALWLGRIAKRNAHQAAAAAVTVLGGVVWHRLNVSWFGLIPASGVFYVPSWLEIAITLALVMIGILVFIAAAQLLPVFPRR
ncbi:MAG: polysulfide reductase NrfD [Candidatus Omnitrophica bacterium]|nr:polysulfide reductase NrfD [Candidatus Omnitrophota bacterium]